MYTVLTTEAFADWLSGLKDRVTRARLQIRLDKAALGNLGDVKAVGSGVYEMREFHGPGCMYYLRQGSAIVLMLGGGSKSSQASDIERARQLAQELQDDQYQDPRL